ncbi:hypothetical protein AAD018_012650 [Aestuariibius insulae]|uniref:hypothetical protein n=1 Tax=Aestuariibius insulae TaxID=2058287 RepID=UPI00345E4D24
MRSMIGPSAAVFGMICSFAAAEQRSGLFEGCFARAYEKADLERRLEQDVAVLVVDVLPLSQTGGSVRVIARLGNSPHLWREGHSNKIVLGSAYCPSFDPPATCVQSCPDQGGFEIVARTDDQIDISVSTTFSLGLDDQCDHLADLSHAGADPATYRLYRVDPIVCLRN